MSWSFLTIFQVFINIVLWFRSWFTLFLRHLFLNLTALVKTLLRVPSYLLANFVLSLTCFVTFVISRIPNVCSSWEITSELIIL